MINDGSTPREMFATQLLKVTNGTLAYSAYVDDVGNKLESYGFHGAGYKRGSSEEKKKVKAEPNRLTKAALPSTPAVLATIPAAAKLELQPFIADVLGGRADPFVDLEQAQVIKSIVGANQTAAAGNWATIASGFLGDVAGGVAAGQFLIPEIDDTRRWQHNVTSGGLLVALASTKEVLSVYFTDGTTKAISGEASCVVAGQEPHSQPALLFPDPNRGGPGRTGGAGHRAGRHQEGEGQGRLGSPLRLYPTRRAIRRPGDQDGRAQGQSGRRGLSLRPGRARPQRRMDQSHVEGQGRLREGGRPGGRWERVQLEAGDEGGHDADHRRGVDDAVLQGPFAQHGNSHASYSALVADYPGLVEDIDKAYTLLYGAPQLRKVQLDASTATATADVQRFSARPPATAASPTPWPPWSCAT